MIYSENKSLRSLKTIRTLTDNKDNNASLMHYIKN